MQLALTKHDRMQNAYAAVGGRVLFALIFILSGFSHFTDPVINYAAEQGVPFATFLVPLSGLLAILGGLSIALGYYAKVGGWLLVAFLVPVTLKMHAFWGVGDPGIRQIQQIMFMKNLALLGGALAFTYFGSGPYSLKNLDADREDLAAEMSPPGHGLDHHPGPVGLPRVTAKDAQEKRMERRDNV